MAMRDQTMIATMIVGAVIGVSLDWTGLGATCAACYESMLYFDGTFPPT